MRLLLVDGHYYLYRSFFAIRGLKNSRGEPNNAVLAFAKAIRKMILDVRPTHGAVLWDAGIPERRLTLQPEYKQQRPAMPDDLQSQEEPIMELCPFLGLRSLSIPSTEADDLIASYAISAAPDMEVVIATSDKDILQLASSSISIYSTSKRDLEEFGNGGSFVLLGPGEVEKKWGVPASAIGDVLSLTGDASDNIPGVTGVGQKTATGLIREFGDLKTLLSSLDRIPNEKLRTKLLESSDLIRANQEMVRLDDDIPLPLPIQELGIQPNYPSLIRFFRHWELRSLLAEAERDSGMQIPPPAPPVLPATSTQQGELF